MSKSVVMSSLHTKVGALGVVITEEGLGLLLLPSHDHSLCHDWVRRWEPDATVVEVAHSKDDSRVSMLDEELTGYFDGNVHTFRFPLDLRGTPFQ
ncbi:MAG TPA: hypothetical protein VLQ48_17255, partial [Chloroflexia bacterium]|nr:hypothetical protein [Chloroflexia bacterium]